MQTQTVRRQSFTMTEILVVIAIIAILGALLSAGVMKGLEVAKENATRQMLTGHLMNLSQIYINDTKDYTGAVSLGNWRQVGKSGENDYRDLLASKGYIEGAGSAQLNQFFADEWYVENQYTNLPRFKTDPAAGTLQAWSPGPNNAFEEDGGEPYDEDDSGYKDDIVVEMNL
jgi:prepilin-type N-terminal cleavage/methylation domain-containing protein